MTDATTNTDEAVFWFARLRDLDATEADWLAFIDWIQGDPGRRDAYDAIERAWVEADTDTDIDKADDAGTAPVRLRPANDDRPARMPHRRRLFAVGAMAACFVLGVGVWSQVSHIRVETYETGAVAETVTLADGSTVWLNRNTAMEVRMGRRQRDVRLSGGEAAFDVAHDVTKPFTVHAGDRSVRVLGTAFDVIHQGERFVVQVERGSVAVTPLGAITATSLTAGQSLRQSGSGAVSVNVEDPEAISIRRSGILVYRDAMMAEVIDDLSLYLGKKIIAYDAARELRFSGVLKSDDEVAVFGQLEAFAPIRVERTSSEVRISVR